MVIYVDIFVKCLFYYNKTIHNIFEKKQIDILAGYRNQTLCSMTPLLHDIHIRGQLVFGE